MKKLGTRNYALIEMGVKTIGSYDPDQIFFLFEEQLYIKEADTIYNFLKWVHNNDKHFGHGNYEEVFSEFLKAGGK